MVSSECDLRKIPLQELQRMNTKRLLAYKRVVNGKAYLSPEEGFYDCGCGTCEDIIAYSKEWKIILNNIKTVLATREHIEK